jgi:hypothetical protein
MAENKKPVPVPNKQLNESVDFRESALKQQNTRDSVLSVMQRVPITPTPTRPPDKDKK